ncbi:very low-density lipoprotein receptor isoform X2 [Frankliniella occidentalis]|uniref:Very low-density lipoprotein receptor isoform X2 n=1 Tax=Frankliniella occidentalis TaxID=133901 RepID=A0A6J1TFH0_FRAOC|nr:very low-density lipoprotein receptor isoform X2 [Frankliniella occidentalis]
MLLSITVAVVILAFKGIVGEACFASDFTCNDGQCLSIWKKCNGIADCSDGADEDIALCRVGARNVSIGEKLIARVQYKWEFYNLDVYLCNSTNCTSMSFDGYTPDGRLCTITSYPATCGAMNSGEFIFEIERRFDGLSIWLYGHANNRKWFSAPKDYNELLIRPSDWYHDMAIQFSGDIGVPNGHEFQCSDGQILSVISKCDGARDCSDGADEDPAVCNNSSVDLTRSDASAQVMYKAEHGPLHFLFCNSSECTNIRIVPCAEGGGGQQRKFRYDSCNAEGVFCNGGAGSFCEYEESWPTGVYIFDVTLKEPQRQSRSVEIRLRGAGPFAFDSVGEGHTRLRIRPGNWISDMPVQFVAMPGSTSTVTTPISTPVTFPSTSSTSTSALPEQTTTTETTPTTKSSWPPLPAPSTCDPRYAYLLIPEPGRCDGYRICLSGRSSGATCPPPLLFSYHLQDCALPNYVDC